jgi:hypothetical protein
VRTSQLTAIANGDVTSANGGARDGEKE